MTGPFSSAPVSYASAANFPKTGGGGSTDNYLFAYQATGSGGSGTATATFANLGAGASVWIDVVELGSGEAPVACSGCTDSGTSSPPAILTGVSDSSDSELAFVGTADSAFFTSRPTGFTRLGGALTGIPYGTYFNPQVAALSYIGMNAADVGWGTIGVEVSP